MSAPRFIDIDGKRYLWRDLLRLRQEQREARGRANNPRFSSFTRIAVRRTTGRRRAAISNPPFLPSRIAREFFPKQPQPTGAVHDDHRNDPPQ
jgi:hypothetical protein